MRIAINVTQDGSPRIVEEDIDIAIGKALGTVSTEMELDITEQDDGCFTADTTIPTPVPADFGERVKAHLEADTGGEVTVEIIEGWPPSGYQSDQGFSGKRMGAPGEGIHSGFSRGAGPSGKGS